MRYKYSLSEIQQALKYCVIRWCNNYLIILLRLVIESLVRNKTK